MAKAHTITKTVRNESGFNMTLDEAISWLRDAKKDIPVQHRVNARVEVCHEGYGDYPDDYVRVSYWRTETPEEAAAREEGERGWERSQREKRYREYLKMQSEFADVVGPPAPSHLLTAKRPVRVVRGRPLGQGLNALLRYKADE